MTEVEKAIINQVAMLCREAGVKMTAEFEGAFNIANKPVLTNNKIKHIIEMSQENGGPATGLEGSKAVKIKCDRKCIECGKIIPKGSLALTYAKKNEQGVYKRWWKCQRCGEKLYDTALEWEEDTFEPEVEGDF